MGSAGGLNMRLDPESAYALGVGRAGSVGGLDVRLDPESDRQSVDRQCFYAS